MKKQGLGDSKLATFQIPKIWLTLIKREYILNCVFVCSLACFCHPRSTMLIWANEKNINDEVANSLYCLYYVKIKIYIEVIYIETKFHPNLGSVFSFFTIPPLYIVLMHIFRKSYKICPQNKIYIGSLIILELKIQERHVFFF